MWFGRRRDPRIGDELRFHRDRLIDDYMAAGMDRAEATRQAFLKLGNVAQVEEAVRDVRGRWLEDLAKDLRYTLRTLRRSPGFSTVATLSFALGIGANVAIFTLINAVMLRSLASAGAASARADHASPGRARRAGVVSALRAVPRQRQIDLGRVRAGLGQPGRRHRRTGGVRHRGARQRRLLHRPWNRAGRGPVAGHRGHAVGVHARSRHQHPVLAAPIRRQSISARQDRHDSRSGLHDRGGDARVVRGRQAWSTAGPDATARRDDDERGCSGDPPTSTG